jgi:hypothetical protein
LSLLARQAESSTWYPATPNRAAHRKSTGSMRLGERFREAKRESSTEQGANVSEIRGLDKLEIYFK